MIRQINSTLQVTFSQKRRDRDGRWYISTLKKVHDGSRFSSEENTLRCCRPRGSWMPSSSQYWHDAPKNRTPGSSILPTPRDYHHPLVGHQQARPAPRKYYVRRSLPSPAQKRGEGDSAQVKVGKWRHAVNAQRNGIEAVWLQVSSDHPLCNL